MNKNLLEDVPLAPKYLSLNPVELDKFDKEVGQGNRSQEIRKLIRKFLKERGIK